jgi:dipeptidase E
MLGGAEAWLRDQVDQQGSSAEIQTWTTLEGKKPADLNGVDLLLVGGGNTFRLLQQLQAHQFLAPIRQWVEAGGDYYGGSAGAVLATESIAIAGYADSNDVGLIDLDGLGLLPEIALLPHYAADQQDLAHSISRDLGRLVVAVPESAGLVVEQGEVRTVGPHAVWTITSGSAVEHPSGTVLPLARSQPNSDV